MSLFGELKRRNVFRVGAAYTVASWLLIQVAETIFPLFGFGDTPARIVVIVLAIGLIPALISAWAFELTPEGLKKESDVDREASTTVQTNKKLDRIIMMVLALALGYFAVDKFVLDPVRDLELVEETTEKVRSDALLDSYGEKSIAVLPFVDMSADGDQEYMSDGIAEELLNLLARIPELRVVSRSSAFAFKGKEINIPSVAEQLNVAYVLEGSVRQAGDQLRITAQLIEAETDTHIWSETYDRKLENIFQIQDEISAKVVEELKITLLGETPKSRQINEQAYKMALQARFFWNRRAEGDADAAFELYQQALKLAPEYAPAWAGISVAYRDQTDRNGAYSAEEGMALAREAAEKALQLDPELADAHIRIGQLMGLAHDYEGQRKAFETALTLEPNNSTALSVMAGVYLRHGQIDEASALYERAATADPMNSLAQNRLVDIYVRKGRFVEAEEAVQRAYELSGNAVIRLRNLSYIYTIQGHYQDVLLLLEDQAEDWPKDEEYLAEFYLHLAVAYHGLGRTDDQEEVLKNIDTLGLNRETAPLFFAALHSLQGDLDQAFPLLEISAKDVLRHFVDSQPYFGNMMSDPRWEPALEKFESMYATSK